MNPAMVLMQMMRSGSPKQFLQSMIGNSQVIQNPMAKNVIDMAQKGDMKSVEQLARNMCKERGIDVDSAVNQIKNQYGL